ncbi:SDR family oxidoreductase [Shouchella sp. JSM 1781072]|uniref:SDR family oxidoreductase n=1 Tax=Bacillaceae TaxID=186817 RepID=UPI000C080D0D|nr:SDR family oxidoreductase [Bacillus sp. Marseille-P3800]
MLDRLFNIDQKVAIITGGSTGLGLQIAETFARAGSIVILCSRKKEQCEEKAKWLCEKGYKAFGYGCDVTQLVQIESLLTNVIDQHGNVDILVNNSGATWGESVEKMPLDAWNKVMNVNVTGTFLMSQQVGKEMIRNGGGKIINVSSIAGMRAEPPEVLNAIGYSTSKAAILHFTKDLARKWAAHNIHVNAIAPGFFPSKMTRGVLEEKEALITANNPMKRLGDDETLIGVMLFLASAASDYITGQVIAVDGGSSL